ncbi:MAG: restriction endonuclease, partial [Phycisphaerales bacterium]|nr:restriction endonuclease [Phycisphaerales bacterium]
QPQPQPQPPAPAAATDPPSPPAPPSPPVERLSFNDATERVLETSGGRTPMHYRRIARRALDLGLVATAGRTPEATLYAQVIQENQRRTRRGEPPRFATHGKGYIGLAKWMATGLAFQIEQHNAGVRKRLRAQIGAMPPADFEALVGTLLSRLGFADVTVTGRSGDGGIDVRGTMVTGDVVRTRMAVQVKRWRQNVQAPVVQQVRGSLGAHEQGLIITTSGFGTGARAEAERADATPVALMDGEQLVKLLVENDIGVRRARYDLIELRRDEDGDPPTPP